VPTTTESGITSVVVCTSDLLVAGMDIGASRRPFDQVNANVVRSTASRTAHTAVPLSNISQYNSDMYDMAIDRYDVPSAVTDERDKRFTASDSRNARSTVIDDAMNGRNMHYTASNAPVISSTAAANAAMAEIGRFSRSNNNNKGMQFDDDVCISDTVSARMHEVVQRDSFDLTDLFCRVQARRAQQAQHSQQLYTLVDEDYPTAGNARLILRLSRLSRHRPLPVSKLIPASHCNPHSRLIYSSRNSWLWLMLQCNRDMPCLFRLHLH